MAATEAPVRVVDGKSTPPIAWWAGYTPCRDRSALSSWAAAFANASSETRTNMLSTYHHHDQASATTLLLSNGEAVVALVGELDMGSAHVLVDALSCAHDASTATIYLNLSRVTYMDSTGLDALLRELAALRSEGRALMVTKLSPTVRRLFQITGIEEHVMATAAVPAPSTRALTAHPALGEQRRPTTRPWHQ
jgi:anti-sigma B factor antagonist